MSAARLGPVLLGAGWALVVACGRAETSLPRTPPRSVVVYLVDTLRADHLGCYGYERETSPRLDQLAADGLLFENCLAQSTWTKPATASLLTGLFPSEHGLLGHEAVLPPRITTLAQRLADAGLGTGAFVTNQHVARPRAEMLRGFEHRQPMLPEAGEPYVRAAGVVDAALAWIEERGDEPFLAYLHTVDPHTPYGAPEPFLERFTEAGASDVDGGVTQGASREELARLSTADVQRLVDLYDGEIAYGDRELGRFLDGLEALGRSEDTMIVFLSDHGEGFREHDWFGHNPLMHVEVTHVPLILSFPPGSGFPTGRRSDVCGQVDVLPTLLDALGLPPVPELPGRSLLAPLRGPAPPLFSEVEGTISRKAVVHDGHKYVRQWSPTAAEHLYDLTADPRELVDLAGSAGTDALRSRLDAFVARAAADTSLLVQNGGTSWLEVEVTITSDAPLRRARLLYMDRNVRGERLDGPLLRTQEEGQAVLSCEFHLSPGDGDGLLFEAPPEGSRLTIDLRVDGEPADPLLVRLGATDERPTGIPFTLEPGAAPDLRAPTRAARSPIGDDPYRVTLWRALSASTEQAELSDEDRRALEALGYASDE